MQIALFDLKSRFNSENEISVISRSFGVRNSLQVPLLDWTISRFSRAVARKEDHN